MHHKFKAGQLIKVKNDADKIKPGLDGFGFVSSMDQYRGKFFIINYPIYDSSYALKSIDGRSFIEFIFDEKWLELVEEDNFEVKEYEIEALFE